MCGMGLLFLYSTALFLLDSTQSIWAKLLLSPIVIPVDLMVMWAGFSVVRASMKINALLQAHKDETRNSLNTVLLYERGVISNKWIPQCGGTWENQFVVIPWYNISYLHFSRDAQPSGITYEFAIKTKNDQTVDISLGGQELFSSIEQRMKASSVLTTR